MKFKTKNNYLFLHILRTVGKHRAKFWYLFLRYVRSKPHPRGALVGKTSDLGTAIGHGQPDGKRGGNLIIHERRKRRWNLNNASRYAPENDRKPSIPLCIPKPDCLCPTLEYGGNQFNNCTVTIRVASRNYKMFHPFHST